MIGLGVEERLMKKTEMTRTNISFALLLAFASTIPAVSAQAPAAQRDYSKVEIKANKITDNFYTLDGDGGTMGVLVGPDGALLVDTQRAQLTEKIVAAVKQLSSAPIRFVVDTHAHTDHTGGNENFGKMGVPVIARDGVRTHLADGTVPTLAGPAPAAALPLITFEGHMTLHMDGEDVELIPVPHAHTDGDTIVRFPKNNVIMCGDFFRSTGYPNIDRPGGGTLNGMIEGPGNLAGVAESDTKIVPGHGSIVGKEALIAQRNLLVDVRDRIAKLIQEGKGEQEVIAAHPTADYDAKVPQGAQTADRFVSQMYAEVKARASGQ